MAESVTFFSVALEIGGVTRLDRFISRCRTHEAEWCSPQSAVLRATARARACVRACVRLTHRAPRGARCAVPPRRGTAPSVSDERLNNLRRFPPGLQGSPWTVRQTKRAPKSARDAGMGTADARRSRSPRDTPSRGACADRSTRPLFFGSLPGAGKKRLTKNVSACPRKRRHHHAAVAGSRVAFRLAQPEDNDSHARALKFRYAPRLPSFFVLRGGRARPRARPCPRFARASFRALRNATDVRPRRTYSSRRPILLSRIQC